MKYLDISGLLSKKIIVWIDEYIESDSYYETMCYGINLIKVLLII